MFLLTKLIFFFFFLFFSNNAIFYSDPDNGEITNDGSIDSPLGGLQEIFSNNLICTQMVDINVNNGNKDENDPKQIKNPNGKIHAGDTIILRKGFHGVIQFDQYHNEDWITIEVMEGDGLAMIGWIFARGWSKWKIKGLTVSPSFVPPLEKKTAIINFDSHNWYGLNYDIIVEDCAIGSIADSSGWTIDNWNQLTSHGVTSQGVNGRRITIRNNYMLNVDFGVLCEAQFCVVEGNTIENFAGDGMDGLAPHGLYQKNVIKNCYNVNGNHDDGFQTWRQGYAVVKNITIRENYFINYMSRSQGFIGPLMGIGLHDSGNWIEEYTIEGNLIYVDDWLGISSRAIKSSSIRYNTIVDADLSNQASPQITLEDHNTEGNSIDNTISNNIVKGLLIDPGAEGKNVIEKNYLIQRTVPFYQKIFKFENVNQNVLYAFYVRNYNNQVVNY